MPDKVPFYKKALGKLGAQLLIGSGLQPGDLPPLLASWQRTMWRDYLYPREVDEGYKTNDLFFTVIQQYLLAYPAAVPVVLDRKTKEPLPDHPLQLLLENPNEDQTWEDMQAQKILYACVSGNAYNFKRRNPQDGRLSELYVYNDGQITPNAAPNKLIDFYRYDIGAGRVIEIAKSEMFMTKWPSPDPNAPWKAQSPMISSSRMGDTDKEVTRKVLSVLQNAPHAGLIVGIKGNDKMIPAQDTGEAIKGKLQDDFTGDNRGKPMILNANAGVDVHTVGLNIKDMDTSALRDVTENRVCSAYLTNPAVVGLGASVKNMTYDNLRQFHILWYTKTLVPMWESDARRLTKHLAPEYKGYGGDVIVKLDYENLPIMVERTLQLYQTANAAFASRLLCRREARKLVRQPDIDNGSDVFDRPLRVNLSGIIDPQTQQEIDEESNPSPQHSAGKSGVHLVNGTHN